MASLLPAGQPTRPPCAGDPGETREGPEGEVRPGRYRVSDRTLAGTLPQWRGTCWGLLSLSPQDLQEKPSSIHTRGPSHAPAQPQGPSGRQESVLCAWWVPGCCVPVSVPEGPQHLLPHMHPEAYKLSEGAKGYHALEEPTPRPSSGPVSGPGIPVTLPLTTRDSVSPHCQNRRPPK